MKALLFLALLLPHTRTPDAPMKTQRTSHVRFAAVKALQP